MRFISSIGGVLLTHVQASSPAGPPCTEDIIRTADSQGFMRTIINCMRDPVTNPGPMECLASFIADNAVGNPFPITDGACRDAYQSMLTVWQGSSINQCTDVDLHADDPISIVCVNTNLNAGLTVFQSLTGFFPTNFCSAAQVRTRARDDAYFATNVAANLVNPSYWSSPQTEACDYCYGTDVFALYFITFYDDLASSNPAILAGCTDPNGPNTVCMRSTTMIDARIFFAACAGYDILFEGPVCSANQIALVQALFPRPFYTFAYCAYNPRVPFCTTIDAYVMHIETITSVDCVACYTELSSDLAALALADTTGICTANVLSDACLTYVESALANFESCSGMTIGTGSAQ